MSNGQSIATLEQSQQIAAYKPAPREVVAEARAEAVVLADIIEQQKLYKVLGQKRHVFVEGWTTLAALRGCTPREVSNVQQEDGSYIAVVELVRMSDGAMISRASAECGGPDEPLWNNRPPYARRSMAATRATSKSIRIPFAWVMVLGGYAGTPAEEMDGLEEQRPVQRATRTKRPEPAEDLPAAFVPYKWIVTQYDTAADKSACGHTITKGGNGLFDTKTKTLLCEPCGRERLADTGE